MTPINPVVSVRGDHSINLTISYELKERIEALSKSYDLSMADTVRQLLRLGVPVLEGMADLQLHWLREYVAAADRLRETKGIRGI